MIWIPVILLMGGAALVTSDDQPPHYVQSREYFDHAKYYLQSNLPLRKPDIRTEVGKRNAGFGIVTGVFIDLVNAADNSSQYDPYEVLSTSVPTSWKNYLPIAHLAQNIISEIDIKTKTITDYISNTCSTESIEECNRIVDEKVKKSPSIYRQPARLLLLLGPVSQIVVENQQKIDSLTGAREEIPYLLHKVDTDGVRSFVDKLLAAYRQSRNIQFRRILNK